MSDSIYILISISIFIPNIRYRSAPFDMLSLSKRLKQLAVQFVALWSLKSRKTCTIRTWILGVKRYTEVMVRYITFSGSDTTSVQWDKNKLQARFLYLCADFPRFPPCSTWDSCYSLFCLKQQKVKVHIVISNFYCARQKENNNVNATLFSDVCGTAFCYMYSLLNNSVGKCVATPLQLLNNSNTEICVRQGLFCPTHHNLLSSLFFFFFSKPVFWNKGEKFSFFWPFHGFMDRTAQRWQVTGLERLGVKHRKGHRSDSNPGLLQQRQGLCTWERPLYQLC